MNKIALLILFLLYVSKAVSQEGDINFNEYQYDESVNFFNPGNISNIPFFYPNPWPSPPPHFMGGNIYFGLMEINSGKIDIAFALNSTDGLQNGQSQTIYRNFSKASWNSNNGNGGFGSDNNYYINEEYSGGNYYYTISGCVVVKLRDNDSRSDFVVSKYQNNGIRVFWNNGSIGNVQQTINLAVSQIEKGKFNYEDTREDVAVKVGNEISIYKNLGNGYLENNFIHQFSSQNVIPAMFKLKQMNERDYDAGHWPENESDRADLIILNTKIPSQPKIEVYLNTNSNTFSTTNPWTISVDNTIARFEVADVDGDGYNDIITASWPEVKIYKNVQGQFIHPVPIWANTVADFVGTPSMLVADVNKDGYGDLICTNYERITKLFLNTRGLPVYNSIPDQILEHWGGGHRNNIHQTALADIYNTGGLALICSDHMHHAEFGGYSMIENSLKVLNAFNYNPAPQPVVIKADLYNDNGIYRPRITINDTRRERDFSKYWVGKYNYVTMQQTAFPITTNTFIDYSEYVLATEDEGDAPPYNRWYSVIQMDLTSKWSPASNRVYFTVGSPVCYTCSVGDNPDNGNSNKPELPHEYSMKNFPNPFNPVTKIYYIIPEAGNIKITVYNIQGKSVQVVVNSFKGKGSHVAEFNGSNLPSGIYFYKLESKDIEISKKMILVK